MLRFDLFPGIQQVKPVRTLVDLGRTKVHIDAEGATIDLRRADFDQFEQRRLELALIYDVLQGHHGLPNGRGGLPILQARLCMRNILNI